MSCKDNICVKLSTVWAGNSAVRVLGSLRCSSPLSPNWVDFLVWWADRGRRAESVLLVKTQAACVYWKRGWWVFSWLSLCSRDWIVWNSAVKQWITKSDGRTRQCCLAGGCNLWPSVEDGGNFSMYCYSCVKVLMPCCSLTSLAKLWHSACQSNNVGGTVMHSFLGFFCRLWLLRLPTFLAFQRRNSPLCLCFRKLFTHLEVNVDIFKQLNDL